MSKMSHVVVLALAACLIPGALSFTYPCEDETKITTVKTTIESCTAQVSPTRTSNTYVAERVADSLRWAAGCPLDIVTSELRRQLESFGSGIDPNRAIDCVTASLGIAPENRPEGRGIITLSHDFLCRQPETCKDEKILRGVRNIAIACMEESDLTSTAGNIELYADKVVEMMTWETRCDLELVPGFLDYVLEDFNWYGRARKAAVECVHTRLPRQGGKQNE